MRVEFVNKNRVL